MQIQGVLSPNSVGPAAAATVLPQETRVPADTFVPGQAPPHFLSDYKPVLDGPMDLPDQPAPRLQRPLLFLNGYMGVPEQFRDMTAWLERDGANRSGGILDAAKPGPVDPQANVFALKFSKQWNSIEANAAEVQAAVEAICRATGATGVDVVCHSKGGLDVRKYLMDATEKVDHVAMIGTPNKGTFLANLELVFRERFGYPIHPPISDPEVGRTLHQLTVDRTDRQGRPYNPDLRELNNGWDTQRGRADFLAVTGSGIPTVTEFPGLTLFGDGVVARKSATMPNVQTKHLWFRTHGSLTRSKSVMTEVANFLTGKPLSPGVDLFDTPEDRQKALELGLLQPVSGSAPAAETGAAGGACPAAQEALKLPILDPVFQLGMAMGVLSAMMGGAGGTSPEVAIRLVSHTATEETQAEYRIDLENPDNPLNGTGTVAGKPLSERARMDQGRMQWQGSLGEERVNLHLEVDEQREALTMKGACGSADADLTLGLLASEGNTFEGLRTSGRLAGQPYAVDTLIKNPEGGFRIGGDPSVLQVRGHVNGDVIHRDYLVRVEKSENGYSLHATGSGFTGETLQDHLEIQVQVRDRR